MGNHVISEFAQTVCGSLRLTLSCGQGLYAVLCLYADCRTAFCPVVNPVLHLARCGAVRIAETLRLHVFPPSWSVSSELCLHRQPTCGSLHTKYCCNHASPLFLCWQVIVRDAQRQSPLSPNISRFHRPASPYPRSFSVRMILCVPTTDSTTARPAVKAATRTRCCNTSSYITFLPNSSPTRFRMMCGRWNRIATRSVVFTRRTGSRIPQSPRSRPL